MKNTATTTTTTTSSNNNNNRNGNKNKNKNGKSNNNEMTKKRIYNDKNNYNNEMKTSLERSRKKLTSASPAFPSHEKSAQQSKPNSAPVKDRS